MSWPTRRVLPGSARRCSERACEIRRRSSAAAARVKVTARIRVMSSGLSSRVMARIIRSVSAAVLPEPAAAETKRSQPRIFMAAACAAVHTGGMDKSPFRVVLLFHFRPEGLALRQTALYRHQSQGDFPGDSFGEADAMPERISAAIRLMVSPIIS